MSCDVQLSRFVQFSVVSIGEGVHILMADNQTFVDLFEKDIPVVIITVILKNNLNETSTYVIDRIFWPFHCKNMSIYD